MLFVINNPLRWLYVDFNSYFASVEQQLRPELRGRPIAVVPVASDATCAIAASYEAKAFGIKTGTPVWEAKQKCKELVCVLADHERYVEFHHKIIAEVNRHIPVSDVCSIDEVACRLMKNETSPAYVTQLAARIKQGLAENIGAFVKCSIGVAPSKYLAKIATDLKKPDGFTLIESKDLPHRLYELRLRDLPGVGYNNERRLHLAGIYDIETLLALSPKRLGKAIGSVWGERMALRLQGIDIEDDEPTKTTLGHSHVMAPELREPDKAIYVARRLTLKAASRLRRLGYYAGLFHLSMRFESGTRAEYSLRCYRAQDSFTFLHLLDEAWRALAPAMKGERIKKVSMSLHELVQVNEAQTELIPALGEKERLARAKAERMSAALDKLNHKYGRDSVLIGMTPNQGKGFSGTKIAFTRIPDVEEFLE